jgi:hypothetical protein
MDEPPQPTQQRKQKLSYRQILLAEGFSKKNRHRVHTRPTPSCARPKKYAQEKPFPMDCFHLFFCHELVDDVVAKTNNYGMPLFSLPWLWFLRCSFHSRWIPTPRRLHQTTILALYCTLLMGLCPRPSTPACRSDRPSWLFADYLLKGLEKHHGKCNFISNIWSGEWTPSTKGDAIPSMVHDYRQHYGALDRADSFHMKYLFDHRKPKRTTAQLISYIKICVVNAWILYKETTGKHITQKQFIRELEEMAPLQTQTRSIICPQAHHLVKTSNRGSCVHCYNKTKDTTKKRSSAMFKCLECDKYLYDKCFSEYHS